MRRNRKPVDNRVLLYRQRTASECMNAAFDFIRQNWKILLRYSLYILLPVCIVQTVGIVSVVDGALAQVSQPPIADMITFVLLGAVGFVLLNALIWTMFKLYNERPDGLASVTGRDFRKLFWPILWRMTVAVIPILLLLVPAMALSLIVMMIVPIAFFFYMIAALPILLIAPIYALEQVSILTAIKRAFIVGFRKLGILILMSLTLVIMVYVLEGIVALPWGLLVALKAMLVDPSAAIHPVFATLGTALFDVFSILFCYVTYVSIGVILISSAYMYGSAVQEHDDMSLLADIDNFENL